MRTTNYHNSIVIRPVTKAIELTELKMIIKTSFNIYKNNENWLAEERENIPAPASRNHCLKFIVLESTNGF